MAKSFHCDYCGEDVSPDEERCPNCGRFFKAVKCPVCSYTGKGAEFVKGCPSCGYLTDHNKYTESSNRSKKRSSFRISRIFAYFSMLFLFLLLLYLIYLFSKI